MRKSLITCTCACLILAASSRASCQQVERFDFTGIERIQVDGVSGDVAILPADGAGVIVELTQNVTPSDAYRSVVEQRGTTLNIEEHWRGRNTRGSVKWKIYLPKGQTPPRIVIDTASGDFSAEEVSASIRIDTASGDIDLRAVTIIDGSSFDTASGDITLSNMDVADDSVFDTASGDISLTDVTAGNGCRFDTASGDVELTDVRAGAGCRFDTASGDVTLDGVTAGEGCEFDTASGSIRCSRSKGALVLDTASGNVVVRESELTGRSRFGSASGSVRVSLASMPAHDLRATSASGNVTLEIGDFGSNFTLILIKRQDRGRISCPFEYTSEDTFRERGYIYEEKVVKQGSGGPEIYLRTASGSITVRR